MEYRTHLLRPFPMVIVLFFILIMVSCSPQSKDSYLENYKKFISDVGQKYEAYTEEDWIRSETKYKRYSVDLYEKFKDELTWQEEVLIGKYEFQYNLIRIKETTVDFFNSYLKEDYEKLKGQVVYYYENEMMDDIEFLLEQAQEIGDSAIIVMNDIIEELNIELDDPLSQ